MCGQSRAPVANAERVRLAGNTRPEALPANDLGLVEDGLALDHMMIALKRSPERQAALDKWLADLGDKSSPNYHRWLTPEEFGQRFGLVKSDVARAMDWLTAQGFTVHGVYPSGMTIDVSGTAGQVRAAFGVEMHAYQVSGERHIANASDPAVPVELADVIAGVVSLNDFRPRPLLAARPRGRMTEGSGGEAAYLVTAADLATIYNLTPLFKAGYTGKGETIALVEDSDVHATADWSTFRTEFGLAAYTTGTLTQIHPAPKSGATNCADPGAIEGWDEEPIVDAEYASAAAPGAAIEIASCKASGVTPGVMIALTNLVNASGTHPTVLSVSYGACEAANGAAANAAIVADYELAAAEGISVFAATGDSGAALCDAGDVAATHGIGVNAYASTAYNVAVGGTDFADTYLHKEGSYWSASNSSTEGSAKSYIPEIPWSDSCASPLIAEFNGYGTTFGAQGFCLADYLTNEAYQTTEAGGGGPSGCATGSPALQWKVTGSCHGYAKPAWQTATGNPKDGVRDVPDVALFSGDGVWGHAYVFCDSNLSDEDGATCKGRPASEWSQAGGTSFAAPIMAGIQAVVAQKWGRQGNPNAVYYKLAGAEFGSAALKTSCNSNEGASSSSSCVFHDVTLGSSDINCAGSVDCYLNVLSTSSLQYLPTYAAGTGWDFATGLGSVNAYNLVMSAAW